MGWLLLVAGLYASAFGWLSPRALRDRWRGPDALSGELTESLACDLVRDFVQQTEAGEVECRGALVVSGAVARLEDTRVDLERRTWCLARVPKWAVLRHTKGGPCFPTPPDDLARPLESERERLVAWAQARLAARLEGIRVAMRSEARPRKCAPGERGESGEVPLLEFELLDGRGEARWSFLSTSWLREAVVSPTPANALAALEHWGALRPWVAVVTSSAREEAQRIGGGHLQGTLTLVDAQAGTLRCEAPFAFDSGPAIRLPEGLPQFGTTRRTPVRPQLTEDRVRADFEARYRTAATHVLNEMTSWDAWPVSQ